MKRFPFFLFMFLILSLYGCDKKPEVTSISLDELNLAGSNVTFNETTLRYEVSGNVLLPTLYQNYIVTWTSSQPTYFNSKGEVVQSEIENILLTLTAQVADQTKVFDIIILKKTNVYGHDGTYQLFQQGQSKNNGYMIKDKLPTYFKYEFIIVGLDVTENIIYYTNTKETITTQFTLIELSENRYKHPNNAMIYIYVPHLEAFEVSLIEGDAYEGVLLSKNKTKERFGEEVLYQIDQSQKTLDSDVEISEYWYTYQISFYENGYFSLYYTLGLEYLLEINEYVITPNFVFIYGTFQDIYLRENDRLIYYADYQLLPLSGLYEEVNIRYELVDHQLPWVDSTVFTKDTILESEALEILNSTDGSYQVFSGDLYNAAYNLFFVGQEGVLDYNDHQNYYYHKTDTALGYVRYDLTEDLSNSINANEFETPKVPYDDFILDLEGTYTKQDEIIYLSTTVEQFQRVYPFFDGHLYFETLILGIQMKDGFPTIEVFLNGSYYLGSIIYIDEYFDEFTINDFTFSAASTTVDGVKPIGLNRDYISTDTRTSHYYRVKLDPGYYVFDSDQVITIPTEYSDIQSSMVYNYSEHMAYLEVTEPLDFYVFLYKSWNEDQVRLKITPVSKRIIQEYTITTSEAIPISMNQPFDQSVITDTMDQNTVYKMVFTGTNQRVNLTINGKIKGTSLIQLDDSIIMYFAFHAQDEVRLDIFGEGVITFYEVEDDTYGVNFDIDDTYVSPRFTTSPLFEKETFTYTHTEGEMTFQLLLYQDMAPSAPQSGELSNYRRVSFGLEVKDAAGRTVEGPIKTPGVYTIHFVNNGDVYYYYLTFIHHKNKIQSIELPFSIETEYHPDYEMTYRFTLNQTSYIRFKMDIQELFYLIEDSTNRVLWNVYEDYILTLTAGTYRIEKKDYKWKINYQLSIENLGPSTANPFNDSKIYTYPSTLTVTSTYPNELHRFEFTYQSYLKYQGSNFTVYGTFHPYMSTSLLNANSWHLFNSPYYLNETNIYYVKANTPGSYSITFPLKNF